MGSASEQRVFADWGGVEDRVSQTHAVASARDAAVAAQEKAAAVGALALL